MTVHDTATPDYIDRGGGLLLGVRVSFGRGLEGAVVEASAAEPGGVGSVWRRRGEGVGGDNGSNAGVCKGAHEGGVLVTAKAGADLHPERGIFEDVREGGAQLAGFGVGLVPGGVVLGVGATQVEGIPGGADAVGLEGGEAV